MSLTVRGTILQTPTADALAVLEDHVVTVDDDGVIVGVEPATPTTVADVVLPSNTVLLPGLIDAHIHAPQWPQLSAGLDLPLEQWLFEYTFPLEARYRDVEFATQVWNAMIPSLLAGGTTTAVYYSSIHEDATVALAEACLSYGQRAFVGRVAMDHPEGTPAYYRDEDAAAGIDASHRSIEAIRSLAGARDLVRPIITPRFVPACTDALLEGLGELAAATGALVQTHCSESDWAHDYVVERFGRTDTETLERLGLARDHSVLAHATHLTTSDRSLLVEVGAGVAHCPLSNAYFAGAVFPARAAIDAGLRVGLGTDVAGGPDPSMLSQCCHAVTASRIRESGVDVGVDPTVRGVPDSRIDIVTSFWLATVGGADLLGLPAGLIVEGRVFDAFVVDLGPERGIGVWPEIDSWERTFEKVVRRASSHEITHVWVNGRDVTPSGRLPASRAR